MIENIFEEMQKEMRSVLPGVMLQSTHNGEYLGVQVLSTINYTPSGHTNTNTATVIMENLIQGIKDSSPYQELGQRLDDARQCIAEQEREITQLQSQIDLLKGILSEQLIKTTTK